MLSGFLAIPHYGLQGQSLCVKASSFQAQREKAQTPIKIIKIYFLRAFPNVAATRPCHAQALCICLYDPLPTKLLLLPVSQLLTAQKAVAQMRTPHGCFTKYREETFQFLRRAQSGRG